MPIRRKLLKDQPESAGDLARKLFSEWTKPKKTGQPLIVVEGSKGGPIRIYVIWDRWAELNQTERSEIIMDVVDQLTGKNRLPKDSTVTVAMGLTTEEAERMRIKLN